MSKPSESSFVMPPISKSGAAKWSYFSLIFSLFYFFSVVADFDRHSVTDLVLVVIIYLSFLGLFFGATRSTGNQATFFIISIIGLVGIGSAVTPGTSALFGYAAFLSGYYFRNTRALGLLGLNIGTQFLVAHLFGYWSLFFLGPTCVISASLFVYGFFSQKETIHKNEQHEKNQQIEQISAIAERERIARDMHDLLGHTLSSLALKSELSQKLIEKQHYEQAANEINEVATLARQCLSEVRQAVTGLNLKGLCGEIDSLKKELEAMGFEVVCHKDRNINWSTLDAQLESAVIMICKEAVTNIMKHSNGNRVEWGINKSSGQLIINIKDNGSYGRIKMGNGLLGIKSRVEELGGTVNLTASESEQESVSRADFELNIELPIES
ncbi:sensor histidine kinase [Psychrosphaera sp.]|nr:sensor histidine kinase [Psychrosphaera sp.]